MATNPNGSTVIVLTATTPPVEGRFRLYDACSARGQRRPPAPYTEGVEFWWLGARGVVTQVQDSEASFSDQQLLLIPYDGAGVEGQARVIRQDNQAALRSAHTPGRPIVIWAPASAAVGAVESLARSLESTVRVERHSGDIVLAGSPNCDLSAGELSVTGQTRKPVWPWVLAALGAAAGLTALGVSASRRSVYREEEQWVVAGARR